MSLVRETGASDQWRGQIEGAGAEALYLSLCHPPSQIICKKVDTTRVPRLDSVSELSIRGTPEMAVMPL